MFFFPFSISSLKKKTYTVTNGKKLEVKNKTMLFIWIHQSTEQGCLDYVLRKTQKLPSGEMLTVCSVCCELHVQIFH